MIDATTVAEPPTIPVVTEVDIDRTMDAGCIAGVAGVALEPGERAEAVQAFADALREAADPVGSACFAFPLANNGQTRVSSTGVLAPRGSTEYGLAGTIWSADVAHATALGRRIESGAVGINGFDIDPRAPFGGMKHSGLRREFGPEGPAAFEQFQSIYLPR